MNAADVMPALTVAAAVGCALTAGHIRALTGSAGAVALTISALAG